MADIGQSLDRQIEIFHELGAAEQEIVIDKDKEYSEYQNLKDTVLQSGNIMVVPSLNHLSGENEGIVAELQYFKDHKIRLKILDMPTTLVDLPKGQEWVFGMLLSILIEGISSIEKQKKLLKKEKQRQGIEALKHTSAWENYGRPSFKIPENYQEVMRRWTNGEITAVAAMNLTGIKRTTFYRLAAKYKKGELKL